MNLVTKILYETDLLKEEKMVGFRNPERGNFVVLMGSPGAGKSFAIKNLINIHNYKILNADNWLELVAKKNNIDLSNPGNVEALHLKLDKTFKNYRNNFINNHKNSGELINIICDVTGKTMSSIIDLIKMVDSTGYETTLVYVLTSREEALRRNLQRERRVPEELIMQAYDQIQENYNKVMSLFDNVWIKIGDDLWAPFQGQEIKDEKSGKLIGRQGTFKRPENQIMQIKRKIPSQLTKIK